MGGEVVKFEIVTSAVRVRDQRYLRTRLVLERNGLGSENGVLGGRQLDRNRLLTYGPVAIYAMVITCVDPSENTGAITRGQETLSMPSTNDAFMSLTCTRVVSVVRMVEN